ncbi:hypothetical protein C8E03_1031 [Lachnotalea glycerini]|uniref:Uncharacterized protein n=1 Tax=Lachnotalea glycerini TaxID=1763509 RepID=A0A318EMY2_9FIRM|nr:hypothetical protein [Lachnotalea glycerini]PXV91445.1 hypothetical protein C8E03_1031 [Lachnotalea glycerini]
MQYIITIILIVFPIILEEKKGIKYIQLLWLWVLIGGCYFNIDTPGYQSVFYNVKSMNITLECFYNFTCMIFNNLGLSYQQMVMFWGLLFLFILDKGIVKETVSSFV